MAEYSKRLQERAEENKKKTEQFHKKQREERKKLFEVFNFWLIFCITNPDRYPLNLLALT